MTTFVIHTCPSCSAALTPDVWPAACECGRAVGESGGMPDFSAGGTSAVHERSAEVRRGMERGHAWYRARARLVGELIAQANDSDPLILDAGCGTGAFAAALAAEQRRVVAVDAELPDALDPRVQYARADVAHLPFPDETFDVVLLLDVLEHVQDDVAVLAEVSRVLRRTGSVILTVPALKRLWGPRDELAGHVRRYELEELRDALVSAGLGVERIGFWAATTLPLLAVSRAVSRRRPSVLRAEEHPPALLHGLLGRVLDADVTRALGRGWSRGSSLFAVGARSS